MAKRAVKGIRVNDETLALKEILELGSGGSYIATPHTVRFLRDEFFFPGLSDRDDRNQWEKMGALDGRERARMEARRILMEPKPLMIPGEIDRKIREKFEILI
jgi:trimethylamine---corrinoid protein Co-methyltransferase